MSEPSQATQEILARAHYTHTCASGTTYTLRYLDLLTLCEREVVPPAFVFGQGEEQLDAVRALHDSLGTKLGQLKLMRGMVSAALIDPVVWDGTADERPEGALVPNDLGIDMVELWPIVSEKSDLLVSVLRGAAFRTQDAGTGNGDRSGGDAPQDAGARRDADDAGKVGV